MFSVLLNWLYIACTTFILGCGLACLTKRITGYEIKRVDSLIMMGLVGASVYAQFFSLITGVALLANIILIVLCIIIYIFCRHFILETFSNVKIGHLIIVAVLTLFWSYFTSRGYMHYDTDVYHAQSIEWIEKFGIVTGLGKFHVRFAYNSSLFALSALYSFSFIKTVSLHTVNGFLALIVSITCMDIGEFIKTKSLKLSVFARMGCIYYLFLITDEIVAPASDYATMIVIFFLVIRFLDNLESQEQGKTNPTPFALLCVLGVYAMTLKLTAALILILLIYPVFLLIRDKKTKEIIYYLLSGFIVAVPWLIRTVIISGWLFYPFPELDLFSVDWKIDKTAVYIDAVNIKTWGRALYNGDLVNVPITGWFPNWFRTTLSGTEKLLIIGAIASCIFTVLLIAVTLIKKKWVNLPKVSVLLAVSCSYIFWQYSAPLMRYGYVYVLLAVTLMVGWVFENISFRSKAKNITNCFVFALFVCFGCYKLYNAGEQIRDTMFFPYYLMQQPYDTYDMISYEVDGETFYCPDGGDRCGYTPFPASPEHNNFSLRGEGLKDGFR